MNKILIVEKMGLNLLSIFFLFLNFDLDLRGKNMDVTCMMNVLFLIAYINV